VDILRQGCVIFSRLIKNVTNVFPFYDKTCHTIAGLALKIYRTIFLNEETIGQIPAQGYGGNVNQSTIALYWLRGVAEELRERGFLLSSKLSADGERCILGHFVDGYCESTRTIYQFHGCFFHGCKECYDGESYNTVSNETFYTLRERTKRTTQLFQQHGYTVVEMWECNFRCESGLKSGLVNVLHARDFFVNTNLNPRDALFGGRTSPAITY
jgi:G:T-mismatch repair DNA endonuclease (very short patch repair protein)